MLQITSSSNDDSDDSFPFGRILVLQGVEENIWTKEGWGDGRVEKAA
jgi:hypothetical protein